MAYRASRRRFLEGTLALPSWAPAYLRRPASPARQRSTPATAANIRVTVQPGSTIGPFHPTDLGIVGIYDVDWLLRPEFSMLLDNLAASPGAFTGVRFFGIFTAGKTEDYLPESGGSVWTNPDAPIDFSMAFDALAALTSRGLIPFISLGFFPLAVSDSPINPPTEWGRWKYLVTTFFHELVADSRFGREAIAEWWFEVWNEPNEGRFWSGTEGDYHDLYRATAEAIADLDLPIRLGGPAIAYKPQEQPDFGAPWMERFLGFIASDADLPLDFVSFHRKGTVSSDDPDSRLLHDAAMATSEQLLRVDPERFGGIRVINNEADEKVGFEVPYAPRMHEAGASWLGAVAAIHAGLTGTYRDAGFRFIGAADNANLQLMKAPFDGRRSIMTPAGDSHTDLLKLPAYAFYELVPLLGDRAGALLDGAEHLFPATDIYHLATASDTHMGCLLTWYPDPGGEDVSRSIDYEIEGIPWETVNVARFQIDRERSNAWTAAGGSESNPYPVPDWRDLAAIRQAQELAVAAPIERGIDLPDGRYREQLDLEPYTTILLWITPFTDHVPEPPVWESADLQDGNVILRWTPSTYPVLFSYEVFLLDGDEVGELLWPIPLRSALWVDTEPPHGPRRYGVRAVTASGIASDLAVGALIQTSTG